MPTLRARASSFTAPNFADTGNAVDAGDGTFATWTNASRRGATTSTFGGFDYSSIPANSTITSVRIELRHYESSTGDMGSVTVAGTAVTLATAVRVDSVDQGTSIPSTVEVVHTRGNNTRSTTCYVDWLDVIVNYDEPVAPTAAFTAVPAAVQVGQPITFTDTSDPGSHGIDAWAWDFGADASPATANTQGPHAVTYAAAGIKTVTLTITGLIGSDQASQTVDISGLPLVQVWNGTRWVTGALAWNGTEWRSDAQVFDGQFWRNFG
jgi:PKD repeat protein